MHAHPVIARIAHVARRTSWAGIVLFMAACTSQEVTRDLSRSRWEPARRSPARVIRVDGTVGLAEVAARLGLAPEDLALLGSMSTTKGDEAWLAELGQQRGADVVVATADTVTVTRQGPAYDQTPWGPHWVPPSMRKTWTETKDGWSLKLYRTRPPEPDAVRAAGS